jgi:hypothetical protein
MILARATVVVDLLIPEEATPITDSTGAWFGYKMPDGRTVEPAACLRIESADGESETFAVTDTEMEAVGTTLDNYIDIGLNDMGKVS